MRRSSITRAAAAGLTTFGPGTLTLPNANSYSGNTYVNAGTRDVGNSAALSGGTGTLVLSGGTFQATNSLTIPNPLSFSNANITLGNGTQAPITFTGTATLRGTTTVQGNTVTVPGNTTINVANTGGITFASGFQQDVPGEPLTLSGAGTVLLPTASSYTGGTTISGPTVMLGSNTALSSGVISLSSGTIIAGAPAVIGQPYLAAGTTLANPLLFSGASFGFAGSAPLTLTGPSTLTTNVSLTAANTTTFSGSIGEFGAPRSLTFANSTGTLVLGGTNTFSGGFTLNSGSSAGSAGTLAHLGQHRREPRLADLGAARHRHGHSHQRHHR